jgi:hypothetical protein
MNEIQALPVIRKATLSDSAGILNCLTAAFEKYRNRYTPEAYADTILTSETLQVRLATMCLFVAVTNSGEVVGTIGCQVVHPVVDPNIDQNDDQNVRAREGHIRGMAVPRRGKAAGSHRSCWRRRNPKCAPWSARGSASTRPRPSARQCVSMRRMVSATRERSQTSSAWSCSNSSRRSRTKIRPPCCKTRSAHPFRYNSFGHRHETSRYCICPRRSP